MIEDCMIGLVRVSEMVNIGNPDPFYMMGSCLFLSYISFLNMSYNLEVDREVDEYLLPLLGSFLHCC